jgi:hypothetical protein
MSGEPGRDGQATEPGKIKFKSNLFFDKIEIVLY